MKIAVTTIAFSKNKFLRENLEKFFYDVKFNDLGKRLSNEDLMDFLKDSEVAVIGLDIINEKTLKNLPNLRCIVKYGVGLDNIDLDACKKRNIEIGWEGGVNKKAVAEITLGFMISLSRNISLSSKKMTKGIWEKNGGSSLSELTIGILGFGFIGKEIAKLLSIFGCKILVNDIVDYKDYCKSKNYFFVNKKELFVKSDIITIHTPLNETTKNLFNQKSFSLMKKTSYLINTARGGIIDENALVDAIENQKIKGAALDVFEYEPLTNKNIFESENIICTPHISGNSNEAIIKMGMSSINFVNKYHQNKYGKV
jgi:phosphoglycerate dehydrogenase-like enzyme